MKYLLDTSILIWWLTGDNRLKTETRGIISSSSYVKYVSVISVWEIIIKSQAKKLKLVVPLKKVLDDFGFEILNINLDHVLKMDALPLIHKDPFDRMLIAQSMVENCKLLTSDKKVLKYFN
jgi:PIN domain nuclease of toxin-antitoxin system